MAAFHTYLVVLFIIIKISLSQTTPIRCEDLNIPTSEKNDLCWWGVYLPRQPDVPMQNFPNMDFQEVQRRNAELSSALNYLYGNKEGRFPGKRNPELSTALLNYLNRNQ